MPVVARASGPALRGFPPVIDRNVERLILGSFPSEASLAAAQYYAHPQNQFWRLLSDLLEEPLVELPYRQRLRRVLAHRLGIWDVYDACDREGSGDASIRNQKANQFARLRRLAPRLTSVAFNGQTAGRYAREFAAAGFETTVLPSSSPAHAGRSYEQKRALWKTWWAASRASNGRMGRRVGRSNAK
ncbi:MAG: DNA-deoxyinosine glycosylase [Burkholderiaceae bacterium]